MTYLSCVDYINLDNVKLKMDTAQPESEPPVESGENEQAILPPEGQVVPVDEQPNEQQQIPDENNEQVEDVQEPSHQLSQSLKAISKVKLYYYAHFTKYL